MKTNSNVLLCGVALLAAPFASVQAVTLVSWGPSTTYVTADQVSQRTQTAGVVSFNLSTPITPLTGANYTGGAFYGGIVATGVNGISNQFKVSNANQFNGGSDGLGGFYDPYMFGKVAGGTVTGDKVSGVFLWQKSDFLAGSSVSDSVTLTSLSYTGRVNPGTATSLEARWVIQQGSTYMISANIGLTGGIAAHPTADLSTLSWFSYDPLTSITSVGGSVSSPSFAGVTAAGLYLTATSGLDATALNIAFSAFSAQGTVSSIPEPSTVASLFGVASLALVATRRTKRRSVR